MELKQTEQSRAVVLVDMLWRAYAPYRRGRNTIGDLATMLAVLLLARNVESLRDPAAGPVALGADAHDGLRAEMVRRWGRALAEARFGASPLTDLRSVLRNVSVLLASPPDFFRSQLEVFGDDGGVDDLPWMAAFLTALDAGPVPVGVEFAEVAELLIERHVEDDTLSAGEFHTPSAVARLIVELAAPQPGDRVLDPACGTGSILAAAARRMAGPGGLSGDALEARATDHSNKRLATMNLAVHGVERAVAYASEPVPFSHLWNDDRVDHVMSNPPFNQRITDAARWNWPFGPPGSNGNFAWLQLAWSRLAEDGTAVLVMPAGAAFSLSARDAAIRREMIARRALVGVVALPPNLFSHTSIAVHLWVLARDASRLMPPGAADRVLFIDAGHLGSRKARRTRAMLPPEDVARVADRLHAWLRSPGPETDEPGFSRSVTREEVLERGGELTPQRYVTPLPEGTPLAERDADRTLDELDAQYALTATSSTVLRDAFNTFERLTRDGTGPAPSPTPLGKLADVPLRGSAGRGGARDRLFAGPSGSLIRAEDYVDDGHGGVPVVMPRDLAGGIINEATVKHIPYPVAQRLARFQLQPGDVVLARRGELGRCAVVRAEQAGWVCGTGCFVLRPPAELDADYFAAYLRSPGARAWLEARSTGSLAMKTIPRDVLRDLPVALPDLHTQRAVAAMMARLDEHERRLREQLDLTLSLRQNALTELFAD